MLRHAASMATAAALLLAAGHARSQEPWPSRPITFVVPFGVGGGSDTNARFLAGEVEKILGARMIVQNIPGMNGSLGAANVAKSPPDGYKILYTTAGPQITNPSLYETLPYDAEKDLTPIVYLNKIPNVLVVHPSLPVNSVKELIDYAKANPNKLNFSHTGDGSTSQLAGELFRTSTGIEFTMVPYNSNGPASLDLIAGRIHMTIDSSTIFSPLIERGAVRALGVTTDKRVPTKPEWEAIAETIPGYESSALAYISTTAGTPPAIIRRYNEAFNEVLKRPETITRYTRSNQILGGGTPEMIADLVSRERARWQAVIQKTGIRLKP